MSAAFAVVGAGMAGLTAAARLARHGSVVVYEKSRGFGGRLATRRADAFTFDHGAPYLRARDPGFVGFVEDMARRGVVAPWRGRFAEIEGDAVKRAVDWDERTPHWVGVPGMSAIGRHMAAGLDIRLETRIDAAEPTSRGWRLRAQDGRSSECDALVVALPAAQARALLPPGLTPEATMQGCFALMLGFAEAAPAPPFDIGLVQGPVLSFLAANHSKPGRPAQPAWTVLSGNVWADAHLDDDAPSVQATMWHAFAEIVGPEAYAATHVALHRWRYANCGRLDAGALVHPGLKLALCGDWLQQGRVEAAFLSGEQAARGLLEGLAR